MTAGTADEKGEMRLLSKPIFEYTDPKTHLPLGGIFGMASNGTNPDVLIEIEARHDSE